MVFGKQNLGEVTHSNSVHETLVCSCEHLNSVKRCWKSYNSSIELALKKRLAEVLVNMEKNNLSISSSNTDFVVSDCVNALDSLGTNWLRENKHFVLYLVWAKVTAAASNKHELFIWLWESHALVVSYHRSGLNLLVWTLTLNWVQRPQGKLLAAGYSELIVWSISELNILDKTTPSNSCDAIREDLTGDFKRADNMTVCSVPNKHLTVESISARNQKSIVMTKGQLTDFKVVFWETEKSSLWVEIPKNDVTIVASLAWSNEMTIVWNCNTGDQIVMCSQKVLRVRICEVSTDNWTSGDGDEVLTVRVQKHRIINFSTESNWMIKFDKWSVCSCSLSIDSASFTIWCTFYLLMLRWELLLHVVSNNYYNN